MLNKRISNLFQKNLSRNLGKIKKKKLWLNSDRYWNHDNNPRNNDKLQELMSYMEVVKEVQTYNFF